MLEQQSAGLCWKALRALLIFYTPSTVAEGWPILDCGHACATAHEGTSLFRMTDYLFRSRESAPPHIWVLRTYPFHILKHEGAYLVGLNMMASICSI